VIPELPASKHYPVIVLLPVRDAEADLKGFFASIAGLCDAVVALDDGSTDGTVAELEKQPLVKLLLRNPRREDYRGWDDAENRNRLVEASAAFSPEWILSLDADERFDQADAASLTTFLATDALPGCAYGFRHVHVRRDLETSWPQYQWIYRLFSFEPGQRFPTRRLHFIPVPTSIPRQRWIQTTLRVQHLGGSTDDRRLLRFSKYLEADPSRTYQADYSNVLSGPPANELRRWQQRPVSMPVLLTEATSPDVNFHQDPELGEVAVLSAIIIAQNDEAVIERSVRSVSSQICSEPFEVILVTSGSDRTADIVRQAFPSVQVIELDHPALPGEARNAGLAVAEGMFVTFPGSHVELPPGSLAARLRAHRRGYAMVTDVTLNGNLTSAGWASYFLDQHEGLPGHVLAELNGPPGHCSYARLPLIEVGGFPEDVRTGEDTAANRALVRRGYVALRDPSVKIIHRSPSQTLPEMLRHHFRRGRGWGRLMLEDGWSEGHVITRQSFETQFLKQVPTRLARIDETVRAADSVLFPAYQKVRRQIVLGAIASWVGMWNEILKPAPGKLALLFDRPERTLLVVLDGDDTWPTVHLVKVDLHTGLTGSRALPIDLEIPAERGRLVRLSGLLDQGPLQSNLTHLRDAIALGIHVDHLDVIRGRQEVFRQLVSLQDSPHAARRSLVDIYVAVTRKEIRTTLPLWMIGPVVSALGQDLGKR